MATLEQLETKIEALQNRVTELEDERDIREVLSRYGYNADMGRDQAYVDLYTDDGVVDLGLTGGMQLWEGKDEIMRFITNPDGHKAIEGSCMNLMGNAMVAHIGDGEAIVNSYNMLLLRRGDGVIISTAGNNQWTMKKVDGRWLIKERKRRNIGGDGYGQLLSATPE